VVGLPDIPGAEHRFTQISTSDAGRFKVHWYELGSGPPVVMLHGWPEHAWCWRHVAPLVAERHRVICPDLRGFGWTDAPGRGYDPETFAADTIALMDELGLDRVDLVGHDWGGFAGWMLALRWPERFGHYLVLNTASPWARPSPSLALETWRLWYVLVNAMPVVSPFIHDRTGWVPYILSRDSVNRGITRADAEVYAERLRGPERTRATMLLYRSYLRAFVDVAGRDRFGDARLTVPTRFLFGGRDAFISLELASGWEPHADDMTFELVHDSGHFIQEEKPELVAQRALDLFADG
jgi:pimeloyl-ACP methyl ester carboxylesterase